MDVQVTLRAPISFRGKGLHSGLPSRMVIKPADENTGIVFKRVDCSADYLVQARLENVVDTCYCTSIGLDGVVIHTVEHLMAAFAGMGVDNALVELDSNEVPSMDGSAMPFVEMIKEVGLVKQPAARKYLLIKRDVEINGGDRGVALKPYPGMKISYTIGYDHPLLKEQSLSVEFRNGQFDSEIARARTFGFLKDAWTFRKNNLAKGASIDNVIVIGKRKILNRSLRFQDEFVRHKILDSVGDLSLLGRQVLGHLVAVKSGHALNIRLAWKLMESEECWEEVEGEFAQQEVHF